MQSSEFRSFTQIVRLGAQQRVDEAGIMKATAQLGVSREALCRLLGGLDVQKGTVLAVGHALGLVNVPTVGVPAALAVSFVPSAT